jgi:altronate hydrolase
MKPKVMTGQGKTIRLSPEDNVMVALNELAPDSIIAKADIRSRDTIPAGHKVALSQINSGSPIIKYGQTIGLASKNILPGDHVHTHNAVVSSFTRDYAIGVDARPASMRSEKNQATFEGIVRADGQVATRNYIGILATVSCSASVAHFIADAIEKDNLGQYPHVDGVLALGHGLGCGAAEGGEGMDLLQRCLAGYARNPNFGGILLVGLGCEVNHLDGLPAWKHAA